MSSAEAAIHVIITGRVQGVGYRAWTVEQAQSRGLNGWVRNRRDGTVEAVFSGDADMLDAMLQACTDGPPLAQVVDIQRAAYDMLSEAGFTARATV